MTVEQRLYAVKTDKKWQWLGKLYPAVFTRDRQVLFLSMDKLLSRNTTIVEPSYMFYNSDIVKNAAIFIDEFDATKDTILKKIIDNGLHDKVDYIELFKDIYAALHTDDFPTVLTTPSRERRMGRIVINLYRLLWMIFERKLIIFIRPIHCSLNIELLKK